MKITMKKTAAVLLALLMAIELVPATAATYSSGMIVGNSQGFKELLEIVATKGTYVLLGQNLQLDVNEDYQPEWTSGNPAVATVDEQGMITAVAAGSATITATVKEPKLQTATIEVTVIDPEPIAAEAPEGTEGPEGTEEGTGTEEQTPVSSAKTLVIVINGENEHITYDGEEHVLDRYVATANEDFFDETRIRTEGEFGVTATDCGFYELNLEGVSFTYDDPEVEAHFVVHNSFLKITPAPVTVTANPAEKEAGEEDPELTAAVAGLLGEDTEDMIFYTLTRDPGEEPGVYLINAAGAENQGNYRVEYTGNVLTILEKAEEPEPLDVSIISLYPADEPIYYGAEITLEARVTGAEEGEYTIRWQYSEDYENWIDIPGADGPRYTFIADGETITYVWRAVADRLE